MRIDGVEGMVAGETVRAKLKRTDYSVRKAGGRNRQGSRGSGGEKRLEKWEKKRGKEDIHQALSLLRRGKAEGWRGGVKRRGLTALARSARGYHIAGVRRRLRTNQLIT